MEGKTGAFPITGLANAADKRMGRFSSAGTGSGTAEKFPSVGTLFNRRKLPFSPTPPQAGPQVVAGEGGAGGKSQFVVVLTINRRKMLLCEIFSGVLGGWTLWTGAGWPIHAPLPRHRALHGGGPWRGGFSL